MHVDAKATVAARERQAEGVARLNALFSWTAESWAEAKALKRRTFGPPGERARRRAKTKRQRIARRGNRP